MQTQQDEGAHSKSSAAALVLGSAHLLKIIIRQCDAKDRQHVMGALRALCHDSRRACDELHRRSTVKMERRVQISNFPAAAAAMRSWAARFMREAAAARLGVWCWNRWDQPHVRHTLLLNCMALQAAMGLASLDLRVPALLAPEVDRSLCHPGLQRLTRLSLTLERWPKAEARLDDNGNTSRWERRYASALQRSIENLQALQALDLCLPSYGSRPFDLGRLASSLPTGLTNLAAVVCCESSSQHASALADLAHLSLLQRLRLVNVLSAEWDQSPPPELAGLTHLEVEHRESWRDVYLQSLLGALGTLSALRSARLHGCRLAAGEQQRGWQLPAGLSSLEVHDCRLQGAGSAAISAPALCSLSLRDCSGSAAIFASATALCSLTLHDCEPSCCPPLNQLTALTRLELVWSEYNRRPAPANIFHGLEDVSSLRSLDALLPEHLPYGVTPQPLPLPPLPQLTALRLRGWPAGEEPLRLGGFNGLRDLEVSFLWQYLVPPTQCPEGLEELQHLTRLCLRALRWAHGENAALLQPEQLEPLCELAVLEPASLAPPGWRPPRAASVADVGDDAEDTDSEASSDSELSYSSLGYSDYFPRPDPQEDAEDEQWEALTGRNAFFSV